MFQENEGYPYIKEFLIGFIKSSQVTIIVVARVELLWPATPLLGR